MPNVVIMLFTSLCDHLCLVDRDIDILEGTVPFKKEMHNVIKPIALKINICWKLNHDPTQLIYCLYLCFDHVLYMYHASNNTDHVCRSLYNSKRTHILLCLLATLRSN